MEEKKKKKPYSKPEIRVEEFTPNEYIASCWYVACTQGNRGDEVSKDDNPDITVGSGRNEKYYMDHTGSCSVASNNIITNEGMYENSADQGKLTIKLISPTSWADITANMDISWSTTSADGKRTWTHKGHTGETVPGHPLMS